jgi:hypothetical protein
MWSQNGAKTGFLNFEGGIDKEEGLLKSLFLKPLS